MGRRWSSGHLDLEAGGEGEGVAVEPDLMRLGGFAPAARQAPGRDRHDNDTHQGQAFHAGLPPGRSVIFGRGPSREGRLAPRRGRRQA
jgi:hypothetical protein